jgi:hypothetical protein
MIQDGGLYRVYRCLRCKNLGIVQVKSREDESRCSLCNAVILDDPRCSYRDTEDSARDALSDLVLSTRLAASRKVTSRGIGTKRRVLNIVEALVDSSRGRPAKFADILRECDDAGIASDRAEHFLTVLKEEGLVKDEGSGLVLAGGVVS